MKEVIKGMIQMYSLLREEDVLESLLQNTKATKNSKQQGYVKEASQINMKLLEQEMDGTNISQYNDYNNDKKFRKKSLTKRLFLLLHCYSGLKSKLINLMLQIFKRVK